MDFNAALTACKNTNGMSADEAQEFLALLMKAELSEDDGAELLRSLAERGETSVEVASFVRGLRERAQIFPNAKPSLDVCGTGGSGLTRFNISTTSAFIAAACGIPVAKHGNRGSKRPNGSFDLLDELQVNFALALEQCVKLHAQHNVVFLFARTVHSAVGAVVPYRKKAACRSIFNLAGPLANPFPVQAQIIGCINEKTADVLIGALQELKVPRACVVWGAPGLDEFSVTGPSEFYFLNDDKVERDSLHFTKYPDLDHAALPGGDAAENAKIFKRLLQNEEQGPLRDMLLLNSAAAIDVWNGNKPSLDSDAWRQAEEALTSGKAWKQFQLHQTASNA